MNPRRQDVFRRSAFLLALGAILLLPRATVADSGLDLEVAIRTLREYSQGIQRPMFDQPGGIDRCATRHFQTLYNARGSLAPTTRAEVGRYFQRPYEPGGGFWPTQYPLDQIFLTPHFKFWYTTVGRDSVPHEDVAPHNGVPDYIDLTADAFERSYQFEVRVMGFRRPLSDYWVPRNGGDERWDVFLFNAPFLGVTVAEWFDRVMPTSVTAAPYFGMNSRMYDFFGKEEGKRYVVTTVAHEFLHACQYAYNAKIPAWIAESSATWMESRAYDGGLIDDGDFYDDPDEVNEPNGVDQVYQQLRQWFLHPDIALHVGGGHAYGNVIFINYLTERFGVDIIRDLYEDITEGGSREFGNFWDLLATKGTNWVGTYKTFTIWNYFTGGRAHLFDGYRYADRYPPIGVHPPDRHSAYPALVHYNEREIPEAMSARYVIFDAPPGGFDGTFSIKVDGAAADDLLAAGGLVDLTDGVPDPSFYQQWLSIVGLRGWAAPIIVVKKNGDVVLDEIFTYHGSQEGQRDFEGSDIDHIVLILTNIRPDAEEVGNFVSYAAGRKPRGILSNLVAQPNEAGGVRLDWQLDDLTDIRQVYVVRKRFSPVDGDFDNTNFADGAEVLHAGDRERNAIPDAVVQIVARLSATDTTYLDMTTFEDVRTQSASFDPTAVRYFYAVVPVDRIGLMGAPAIAAEGVTPIPPEAPAFMVATREVRVGMWDIIVRSTRPLLERPTIRITLPDGNTVSERLDPVESLVWTARFDHPHFPQAGIYRYAVRGISDTGVAGSWIVSGGSFRYAPAKLQPRIQIIPGPIHRIADGPVEFYPRGMKIQIYSTSGQFIAEIEVESKWNCTNSRGEKVAPGVYIFVAEDGNGFRETGKLVLR